MGPLGDSGAVVLREASPQQDLWKEDHHSPVDGVGAAVRSAEAPSNEIPMKLAHKDWKIQQNQVTGKKN
jgi:hypothetical protein